MSNQTRRSYNAGNVGIEPAPSEEPGLSQPHEAQWDDQDLSAPLMTTFQVADYLGTGEPVVRHLFRTGKLHAFKVGGQWRTRSEDVMGYVLKKLQKP